MRVNVVGAGAVGSRAIRQLVEHESPELITVFDHRSAHAERVAAAMGPRVRASRPWDERPPVADVTVLATAAGSHRLLAEQALAGGQHVVSVSDRVADVRGLLDLDAEARVRERAVVVGAGFAPGLVCVLARHGAATFSRVDELHTAHHGTGGPACAREHHRSLQRAALDWRDGAWRSRRGRTGRELVWFPDPIGGLDCYRAELPGALLLVPYFPEVVRVTARVSATRRDRLTALLPMLRRPHEDGGPGAARVEIRGMRGAESGRRGLRSDGSPVGRGRHRRGDDRPMDLDGSDPAGRQRVGGDGRARAVPVGARPSRRQAATFEGANL